jgi:hypothetical protein
MDKVLISDLPSKKGMSNVTYPVRERVKEMVGLGALFGLVFVRAV